MGIQKGLAHAVSAVSTAALKHVFHRPAGNFPGKIALYVDPRIIADEADKLSRGSVCVVGTNGKTTITNMVADCMEAAGLKVVCNRTGANLDSGVATSLLHAKQSDWGVFECDELWLSRILPYTQSKYVLLLNLFRDQLDRVGEIDRIQDSIANTLAKSPDTTLVYNADDPLCERIARSVSNKTIPFGIGEDLGLPQDTVSDARMCQHCSGMLEYAYRQYGQLGDFHCPECDFKRPSLKFAARNCEVRADGMSFDVVNAETNTTIHHIDAPYTGVYMIYNLLAVCAAASLCEVDGDAVMKAITAFDPQNGRLQDFVIGDRKVLCNLAKNPTGFNQNISLLERDSGPKAAAFYVNDKEGDGHDISWIWDIDFEELSKQDITAYAGGMRANDLQLRLKYAGIDAQIVEDAVDAMGRISTLPNDVKAYFIANYTALPAVQADLTRMADEGLGNVSLGASADANKKKQRTAEIPAAAIDGIDESYPLRIVHMFPDLLNLYGDGGNITVLRERCAWRGIPVEVVSVSHGETVDLSQADIVFLGGGPDREQKLASEQLLRMKDQLVEYVENDGVLLAICGGFQILGPTWLMGDGEVEGLGLIDITTRRSENSSARIIGDVILDSPLTDKPIVGYENHAGRTYLGDGVKPFGTVHGKIGVGNNDEEGVDGACYRNVIGTYLHGPLLGKNPQVADLILSRAIERRIGKSYPLAQLDDSVENDAHEFMCKRLGA